ncbi:MAG: MgtC/SapB family protein, partial [Chloroflexi bacterium]|nr:MgtC/SapB family protein [Chloroflexota bacterium]
MERTKAGKPAGMRTLALVSLGAALFTVTSIFGFAAADVSRVAAGVVTGVGFLGAGAILRGGDSQIQGLTTAASIWTVAAAGVAVGAGMYVLAGVATVLVLLVLRFLPRGT